MWFYGTCDPRVPCPWGYTPIRPQFGPHLTQKWAKITCLLCFLAFWLAFWGCPRGYTWRYLGSYGTYAPGYLALGARRPLDPDLDPIWHKNGQNSSVSSDSLSFDQLSKAAHGVIPSGIWVLIVNWTSGYLALGHRQPLEANLDTVLHKILGLS